jgi:uncharacterized membrane protein (DUF485 family)
MATTTISAIDATKVLAARRWRIAATLTTGMVAVYFGFIALVAYRPSMLGRLVQDGLSLGIVLGALVIVAAWALTFTYVTWANRIYDPALAALRIHHAADDAASDAMQDASSSAPRAGTVRRNEH